MYPLHKCLQQTFLNELCVKISLLRSISKKKKKNVIVRNAVYFRLCIDLMHILPPVTAEGFDGSHHPRFAEWATSMNYRSHDLKHGSKTERHL